MQRLVLAVLLGAALLLAVVIFALGLRAISTEGARGSEGEPMQKLAFFLLIALIVYVAVAGAV